MDPFDHWRSLTSTQGRSHPANWDLWPRPLNPQQDHRQGSNPGIDPSRLLQASSSYGAADNASSLPLQAPAGEGSHQHQPELFGLAATGNGAPTYTTGFTAAPVVSTAGASAPAPTATRSGRPTARSKRKTAHEWKEHKSTMEDIYMKQDKSQDYLMDYMKRNFHFEATSKQYKTQFNTWGWHKNFTRDVARYMNDKNNRRVLEGKNGSLFSWRNQRFTVEAVQKHLDLTEEEIANASTDVLNLPTPYGVTVETPQAAVSSPATRPPERTQSRHSASQSTATAKQLAKPISLRWNGYTVRDLDKTLQIAEHLADSDDLESAETKYLELLDASKHLLPAASEESAGLSYVVARFFAGNDEMEKADKVLDTLSAEFLERWGPTHEKTLKHYATVGKLLDQWDRYDDALNILKQFTSDFSSPLIKSRRDDPNQPQTPASNSSHTYLYMNNPSLQNSMSLVTSEHEEVSQSLDLAMLQEQIKVGHTLELDDEESTDRVVLKLLERMEGNPTKHATDIIRGRNLLITFYVVAGMEDESKQAMTNAKNAAVSLCALELNPDLKFPTAFYQVSIELAQTLLETDQPAEAENLLDTLQERFTDEYGCDHTDTISLLIQIGKMYERRKKWDLARPYFEAAFAASIDRLGLMSLLAQRLEKCLEMESYFAALSAEDDTSFMPTITL